MNFTEVERVVAKLRQDLAAGRLTEEQFKTRLREMMVQDEQGNWWMVGYETGEWYRHDGTDWVPDQPPLAQPVVRQRMPAWVWGVVGAVVVLLAIVGGFLLARCGPEDRPTVVPVAVETTTPAAAVVPKATPLAPTPTATPSPTQTSTATCTSTATPAEEFPVTGRYAEVWARLGGAEGRLGQPLDPAVEGFYAVQYFEHGLLHWGRLDRMGDPEPEVQIVLYGPGDNRQAGQEWYRYIDYWREGDEEYPCPQASPPLGPKRGFGKVWCECEYCRDHLGAPVEREWGEQGGYQDFQGGVMLWVPREGGLYVLLNQGDWRFEPVE